MPSAHLSPELSTKVIQIDRVLDYSPVMAGDSSRTIIMDRNVPTAAQLRYLARGLTQPGGKLPLFDEDGQMVPVDVVRACIARGLAAPWFDNPIKPDWIVCRLTEKGRRLSGLTGGYQVPVSDSGIRLAVNDAG